MVTVLILESCAGTVDSYGVNSVVTLPNEKAQPLINAGLARIVNKGETIEQIKKEVYPIAIKLNYGKATNNGI